MKEALALFGSTSPSYLTLCSLDRCNAYLAEDYPARLAEAAERVESLKRQIEEAGGQVEPGDPLRLTLAAPEGETGQILADRLRRHGVECEYADRDFLVLMATPENDPEDFRRVFRALEGVLAPPEARDPLPLAKGERVCSIREAALARRATVPAAESLGRICGLPTVGCPPAVPIVVSGERITAQAVELFARYGVEEVEVLV